MSELRQDPITHDWVTINPNQANARTTRPHVNSLSCCPGNEHLRPEPVDYFTEGDRWSVRRVPNNFPC